MKLTDLNIVLVDAKKSFPTPIKSILKENINQFFEVTSTKEMASYSDILNIALCNELPQEELNHLHQQYPYIKSFVIAKQAQLLKLQQDFRSEVAAFIATPINQDYLLQQLGLAFKPKEENFRLDVEILQKVINQQNSLFILSKENKPVFASQPFYQYFNVNNAKEFLHALQTRIKNLETKNTQSPLKKINNQYSKNFAFLHDKKEEYFELHATSITHKQCDTLLSFYAKESTPCDKLDFYKSVKEELEQQENVALGNIQISNYENLAKEQDFELLSQGINELVDLLLEESHIQKASLWDEQNIVYLSNVDLDTTKQEIDNLKEKIYNHTFYNNLSLQILASCTELHSAQDFSQTLRDIHKQKSSEKEIENYEIAQTEQDKTLGLFSALNTNPKQFAGCKILSLYKGLALRNEVKLLEIKNRILTLQTHRIQCLALKNSKTTFLQFPFLEHDLICHIVNIDFASCSIKLNNFKIMHNSPKQRKYARVQPSSKIAASLTSKEGALTGPIFDISTNSLAIETPKLPKGLATDQAVNIVINVLNYRAKKLVAINTVGRIVKFIQEGKKIRAIAEFEIVDKVKSKLLEEYIYYRQKELIGELKQLSRGT